jgi:hypothetical protein
MRLPLWIVPALVLAVAALSARAESPTPAIRDEAGLFNPTTVAQAEKEILEIHKTYGVHLIVETIKSPPGSAVDEKLGSRKLAQYFTQLAREAARKADVTGIYVLVCVDAVKSGAGYKPYVQVIVYPEDGETVLTPRECDRVRSVFLEAWHKGSPNNGLLAALERIREALRDRFPSEADSSGFSWRTFGYILLVFLVLWLVLGVIRARLLLTAPAGGTEVTASGRVTLLSGLLGGMFGSVAGHWVYDTLFHRSHDEPPGSAPPTERPDQTALGPTHEGAP